MISNSNDGDDKELEDNFRAIELHQDTAMPITVRKHWRNIEWFDRLFSEDPFDTASQFRIATLISRYVKVSQV